MKNEVVIATFTGLGLGMILGILIIMDAITTDCKTLGAFRVGNDAYICEFQQPIGENSDAKI